MELAYLNRTLDQELVALLRGVSLECLICGEFVLHARNGVIACPECGLLLQTEGRRTSAAVQRESQSAG